MQHRYSYSYYKRNVHDFDVFELLFHTKMNRFTCIRTPSNLYKTKQKRREKNKSNNNNLQHSHSIESEPFLQHTNTISYISTLLGFSRCAFIHSLEMWCECICIFLSLSYDRCFSVVAYACFSLFFLVSILFFAFAARISMQIRLSRKQDGSNKWFLVDSSPSPSLLFAQ